MPFRKKVSAEEQEAIDALFATARANATTEERDGRTFTVLRFPDRYGEQGPTGGSVGIAENLDSLLDDE